MNTDRTGSETFHPCSSVFIRGRIHGLVFVAVVVLIAMTQMAAAHPPLAAIAFVKVEPGGHITLTLVHDSLAFALNDTSQAIGDEAMYALLHGPDDDLVASFQDGRERLGRQLQITVDGRPLSFQVSDSPTVEGARRWQVENVSERLPVKLEFIV